MQELPVITEQKRLASPATTPQALTSQGNDLWMGSRDLRRVYRIDRPKWTVEEEKEAPGIPWAAVFAGDELWFTLGEGPDDDRYLRRYVVGKGFAETERIACPELTGSYLSYDGEHLHLSQWYKHRILKLDGKGNVLRGTEQGEGDWRIARLDPREETPRIDELARVPFQCRSLTFDGECFWTNDREADRIVSFTLPKAE